MKKQKKTVVVNEWPINERNEKLSMIITFYNEHLLPYYATLFANAQT
jgi:hypothetical protein